MNNPWLALPHAPPFVLAQDVEAINAFNARAKDVRHRFQLRLMPEPYFGSPDAPVVALLLNPGFKEADVEVHRDAKFRDLARQSMAHTLAPMPFLHLMEDLDTPGSRWWRRRTRQLPNELDVGRRLLALQFLGYKSTAYKRGLSVPSMQYTFYLLRKAMERGAEVIVTRGYRDWVAAVPELARYRRLHHTKNPRTPSLSPGNLEPKSYRAIVTAMSNA